MGGGATIKTGGTYGVPRTEHAKVLALAERYGVAANLQSPEISPDEAIGTLPAPV